MVRYPVFRCCRISPAITTNGVISIRSRLTRARSFFGGTAPAGFGDSRAGFSTIATKSPPQQELARFGLDCVGGVNGYAISCPRSRLTMKSTKKCALLLLMVVSFATVAGAQEFPNEPYEFLLAKLAAEEGRYDVALGHIDKVNNKSPDDPVLRCERAMMLIDAGRVDRAETELRA